MCRASVAFMLGLAALAACGPYNPAREAIDAARAAAEVPAASVSGPYWTCPMHLLVHAAEEGPCPICGMALVKAGGD
jgi:hypothetical protein